MTERFIPIHITTERAEVERTCAALEGYGIPILVEHIVVTDPRSDGHNHPGFRIMTAISKEQQARAIVGRAIMDGSIFGSEQTAESFNSGSAGIETAA